MAKGKHAYAKQRRAEQAELDRRKRESFWGKVKSLPKRYFIDAMGAMALGLFASLLIGTIFDTLGNYIPWDGLKLIASYAKAATGMAIGVAFGALASQPTDAALTGAWMLAVGIALQNFPEGAAVSLPLRREGMSRGRAFFFGQLSGAVEPIAGVLGCLLAVHVQWLLPFLLAFAAGAMVMVVIGELVPESQRSLRPGLMSLATMAGFAVMMILDVALG